MKIQRWRSLTLVLIGPSGQIPPNCLDEYQNMLSQINVTKMGTTREVKDLSRAERKLKKRKLEQTIADLPGDIGVTDLQDASLLVIADREHGTKKRKLGRTSNHDVKFLHDGESKVQQKKGKEKKNGMRIWNESEKDLNEKVSSNDKASDLRPESLHVNKKRRIGEMEDSAPATDEGPSAKRTKKERRAEKKAAKAAQVAVRKEPAPPATEDAPATDEGDTLPKISKKNNRNREKKRKGTELLGKTLVKAPRFIVFIGKLRSHSCIFLQLMELGNLPFSTTTESIQKHFEAVHPKSVRHLTKKDEPEKSKGCAFLEFEGYDHMKACLKSFHHSIFDDGISPPRKINVELT
jgi:nucleolar protein 6